MSYFGDGPKKQWRSGISKARWEEIRKTKPEEQKLPNPLEHRRLYPNAKYYIGAFCIIAPLYCWAFFYYFPKYKRDMRKQQMVNIREEYEKRQEMIERDQLSVKSENQKMLQQYIDEMKKWETGGKD